MRVSTDLVAEGEPIVQGDLRALAVAVTAASVRSSAGRARPATTSRCSPRRGAAVAAQTGAGATCDVAWSGDELIVSRGTCGSAEADPAAGPARTSTATPTTLLDGGEPAVAG